ncbi:nadph:adrenodoxin oxidoreductase, partial [Quercus suber]
NLQQIVINQFSQVARHDRCSVFGNVTLGSSVFLLELRELYHVVVLAYGAESDRVLGIPGERICLVVNGHPDCKNLDLDLENTDTAVILGQVSSCFIDCKGAMYFIDHCPNIPFYNTVSNHIWDMYCKTNR